MKTCHFPYFENIVTLIWWPFGAMRLTWMTVFSSSFTLTAALELHEQVWVKLDDHVLQHDLKMILEHLCSSWSNEIWLSVQLNCYRLADATELWAPDRPDIGTVSSLRQCISWTFELLTINMKHTTLLYFLFFNTHTFPFTFKSCT